MQATIENGVLVIRAPLQTPTASASGKTLVVASTHGNKELATCQVQGKNIVLGLNAYIRR